MRKLSNVSTIALSIAMFFACGETNSKSAENSEKDQVQTDVVNEVEESYSITTDNQHRYDIKSAKVTYKMDMMGISSDVITYFDDYGEKEATISKAKVSMMGMNVETESHTVTKDGYIYNFDMQEKTGTRMKVPEDFDFKRFDLRQMPEDMKAEFDEAMNNATTETFLGKECKVIELKDEETKNSSKLWLWKNIALKYQITSEAGTFDFAATSVEEQAVDSKVFDIPSEIAFEEVTQEELEKQMEMMQNMQGE